MIVITHGEPGCGPCYHCGRMEETRFGCCFDCASDGERRAAYHTVWQHLARVPLRLWHRDWFGAKTRLSWAWERLTRTGDYAPGGEFDTQYFNPRPPVVLRGPVPPSVIIRGVDDDGGYGTPLTPGNSGKNP